MEDVILLAGIIEGVQPRKDKSLKITFGANEISANKMAEVMNLFNTFCYVALKKESFMTEEMNAISQLKYSGKAIGKSPAEKMRDVMFRIWEKSDNPYANFDDYYQKRMMDFNDALLDELNKLSV